MKYFTIKELEHSDTAERLGIHNEMTDIIKSQYIAFVDKVLDPIREAYGKPITISSGYRCPRLNKAVGGVKNSQHQGLNGCAADLYVSDLKHLFEVIVNLHHDGRISFDQLLFERNGKGGQWIHISYREPNRHYINNNYKAK